MKRPATLQGQKSAACRNSHAGQELSPPPRPPPSLDKNNKYSQNDHKKAWQWLSIPQLISATITDANSKNVARRDGIGLKRITAIITDAHFADCNGNPNQSSTARR